MGALVNVFKSLFGGILSFFGGLVGGKKGKDGFFMEADTASMEALPEVVASEAVATATKSEKGGKKGKEAAVKAAPAKAPAKTAVLTPEELIVAAVQGKASTDTAAATTGTAGFATQYMVPTLTSGRRSPGPSLKAFKTMAKEIRG